MERRPLRFAKVRKKHRTRTDAMGKALELRLAKWLEAYARKAAAAQVARLRAGKLKLRKRDTSTTDAELLDILVKFGLRQIDSAGKRTAADLDGEWVIEPSLLRSVTASKRVLVQRLLADLEQSTRESIRRIMQQAQAQKPAPSVGEIARRIRTQFHGDASGKGGALRDVTEPGILGTQLQSVVRTPALYAFSPERAALIARTESAQNENTGIFEGMAVAGIEQIEWLSSGSANHGDRRHDLMDGEKIDLGGYFTTPLGNKLRYPGDPRAPIKETANCGCTFAPVIPPPQRRR
jgi:hypothetical protein